MTLEAEKWEVMFLKRIAYFVRTDCLLRFSQVLSRFFPYIGAVLQKIANPENEQSEEVVYFLYVCKFI